MIGPIIVLLAAAVWPSAALAADATVDTQRNAIVVFVVIILLLGSVTAGLLFASPLRRRLTSSASETDAATEVLEARVRDRLTRASAADVVAADHKPATADLPPFEPALEDRPDLGRHAWPQPGRQAHPVHAVAQRSVYAPPPPQPQPVQPQPQPMAQQPQPMVHAQPIAPVPPHLQPIDPVQPQPAQALAAHPAVAPQVQPAAQPRPPVQPRPGAPSRPTAAPWSTGNPQPDANWNPGRRGAP